MSTQVKPAGPAPGRAVLHDAALRYLSQYSATEAGLVRVLVRRVQRWARLAVAEGLDVEADVARAAADARGVAAALVAAGIVSDAAFANARAARLARAGRSRRAIAAHLTAKGVLQDVAAASLPSGEQELCAALMFVRRRRLGPFSATDDGRARLRGLGALARAGFDREVAERALDMPVDEAEALMIASRSG